MSKFPNPPQPILVVLFTLSFSFLLMMVFAPMLNLTPLLRQWDFILLWFISLLSIAVPMLYLESALAKRSQTTVLQGLMSLTRDADAKTTWRMIGWAGVFFISLLSGAILIQIAQDIHHVFNLQSHIAMPFLIGLVIAMILSLLPRLFLYCAMLGAVIASFMVSPVNVNTAMQWTNITAQEWAMSVMMIVLMTGFGMNVYWQTSLKWVEQLSSLNKYVVILLSAFIVASVLYMIMPVSKLWLPLLVIVAVLLQFAREQLQQRNMALVLVWLLPIVAIFLWLIVPLHQVLTYMVMILGLLLCLGYSIFAGWVMKASHLRKSLNFNREISYNVWRVAVRIIVPLQIMIALIIMLQHWLIG